MAQNWRQNSEDGARASWNRGRAAGGYNRRPASGFGYSARSTQPPNRSMTQGDSYGMRLDSEVNSYDRRRGQTPRGNFNNNNQRGGTFGAQQQQRGYNHQNSDRGRRGPRGAAMRGRGGANRLVRRPPKPVTIRLHYNTADVSEDAKAVKSKFLNELSEFKVSISDENEPEIENESAGSVQWSVRLQFAERECGEDALNVLRQMKNVQVCERGSSVITGRPITPKDVDERLKRLLDFTKQIREDHVNKLQTLQTAASADDTAENHGAADMTPAQLEVFDCISKDFILRIEELQNRLVLSGRPQARSRPIREGEMASLEKEIQHESVLLKARLPIYTNRNDLMKAIRDHRVTIVIGETGCGKSTQLVQFLLRDSDHVFGPPQRRPGTPTPARTIVCCEPRKVVAQSLCDRVTVETGESESIGLSVGVASQKAYGPTRIHFSTHHSLLTKCLNWLKRCSQTQNEKQSPSKQQIDKSLASFFDRYACVVIDEAHERTTFADLLIAFLKRAMTQCTSLRVVIMSATMNERLFVKYFDSFDHAVVKIHGRLFPVQISYEQPASPTPPADSDKRSRSNSNASEAASQSEAPKTPEPARVPVSMPTDSTLPNKEIQQKRKVADDDDDAFSDTSDDSIIDDTPIELNLDQEDSKLQQVDAKEASKCQPNANRNVDDDEKEMEKNEHKMLEYVVAKTVEVYRGERIAKDAGILVFVTSPLECEKAQVMFNELVNPDFKRPIADVANIDANADAELLKPLNADTRIEGPDFVSYVLHGQLKLEEQNRLFEKLDGGKRKVVFSTNVAETSITIPEIACVIDCGMSKQKRFDHAGQTHVLERCPISRSGADQRTGRAGRTQPGLCIRLYSQSVYNKMDPMPKAEILTTHLGTSMLQLLRLGMHEKDLAEFDYVESPKTDDIRRAFAELHHFGAVDSNGQLTKDGELMALLSELEPIYARLVVTAAEDSGCVWEACILAALLTIDQRLFERPPYSSTGGADQFAKLQSLLETRKFKFYDSRGDPFVMLEVYRRWNDLDQNATTEWCNRHCVVEKHLRAARELAARVRRTLKKQTGKEIEQPDGLDKTTRYNALQKIIFQTFKHQVAMFAGCDATDSTRGTFDYLRCDKNQTVKVHFTSVFDRAHPGESWPAWVVFDRVLHVADRDRVWMICVTRIEESWLREAEKDAQLNFSIEKFASRRMELVLSATIGDHVKSRLLGSSRATLQAFTHRLRQEVNEPLVNLVVRHSVGRLDVYCSPDVRERVVEMVREHVQQLIDRLSKEGLELVLGKETSRTPVALVLKPGLCVEQFLMPSEFRRCMLKNVPLTEQYDDVPASLQRLIDDGSIDKPLAIRRLSKRREENIDLEKGLITRWGVLTFGNFEIAKKNVEARLKEPLLALSFFSRDTRMLVQCGGESPLFKRWLQLELRLSCLHSRSKGCGEIQLDSRVNLKDAIACLKSGQLTNDRTRFTFSESKRSPNCVYFTHTPPGAFDSEEGLIQVHKAIRDKLAKANIVVREVKLFRDASAFEHDDQTLTEYTQKLCNFIAESCAVSAEKFVVVLQPFASQKEHRLLGHVTFSDSDLRDEMLQRLKKVLPIKLNGNYPVHFERSYAHLLIVQSDLYKLLEKPLILSLRHLKAQYSDASRDTHVSIKWSEEEDTDSSTRTASTARKNLVIRLRSTDSSSLNQVYDNIQVLLGFDTLDNKQLNCDAARVADVVRALCVLQLPEKRELQQLAERNRTLLVFDRIFHTLKLFGTKDCRQQALPILLERLKQLVDRPHKFIDAREFEGVLKLLYKDKTVFDAKKSTFLPKVEGLLSFDYDYLRRRYSIVGTQKAIDSVIELLKEKKSQCVQTKQAKTAEGDQCVACNSWTTDFKSLSRLNACGHAYCTHCLVSYVLKALDGDGDNVSCMKQGCNKLLLPHDIIRLYHQSDLLRTEVVTSMLKKFIRQHPNDFGRCITPNCPGVFRKSEHASLFFCYECDSAICSHCGQPFHGERGC